MSAIYRPAMHRRRSIAVARDGAVGLVCALLCCAHPAGAQELDTVLTLSGGTGQSLGRGADGVVGKRSPMFLEVDVGLIFDGDTSLEWTPSLLIELEGRVSVAVNPSVKRIVGWGPLRVYGGLGFPFFFAPFSMLGVQAAVGAFYPIIPRFSAVLELRGDVFFIGSDLPDDSVLAKLDASLGLRLDL